MPRGKGKILVFISLGVLFLDQLSKFLILKFLYPGKPVVLISNILSFTFIKNTGAAFGLLRGFTFIFILAAIFVVGYIIYLVFKKKDFAVNPIILGLFLGGTMGNLIDRVCLGYVVDFIDFHIWPVFNVADSAITISVGWFIIVMMKKHQ